jgi:hypothetical protein
VTGRGFASNADVVVTWSTHTGSVKVKTDGNGNFSNAELPILIPDLLGARTASAGGASASFLVVPGTAEPGGDQASFLFRSESQ